MRRTALRLGGVAVLTLLAVGALSVAGRVRILLERDARPPADGRVLVEGLEAPVRILRDPFGIPHVEAQTEAAAFLGLGFAHAQDRLWQMELLRRTARGTLSELFGSATLEADRLARTLGLGDAAERESERLDPVTHRALRGYAAGVNRWLDELRSGRARMPFELRWLEVQPTPWTVADTLALVRLRAWLLSRSLDTTLLLDRLVRDLGGLASYDFFPASGAEIEGRLGALRRLEGASSRLALAVGLRGRVGSLGFIIGGSHSLSTKPLLVNDPHVEFRAPPVFYIAHVATPALVLAGATWPGMPVFWTGTNGSAAWGQVALRASVSDLFEETLHPQDPERYDWRGRWLRTETRREEILVRGARPVTLEVRTTRHGPLLGPLVQDDADRLLETLALSWTGSGPRSGIQGLLEVQRAERWGAFRAALDGIAAPPATFLYADRNGNLGVQVAGHLPVRAIDTGLLPVPGRLGYYDWRGSLPLEELPRLFGEDLPWLVASTQPQAPVFTRAVAWLWRGGQGERRLRTRLARVEAVSLEEAFALAGERRSERGRDFLRVLLRDVGRLEGPAARIHRLLIEWDGNTGEGSVGAAVWHVFRRLLTERALAERLPPEQVRAVLAMSEPVPGGVLARYLERTSRERRVEEIRATLTDTWSWLGIHVSSNPDKWTWGQVHLLRLQHDFERLGGRPLRWLGRLHALGPFPAPGDPDSIWSMHHDPLDPFAVRVGPAFRFAVDLGDPEHPLVALCGGQSGHPGAPGFADGIESWLRGDSRPLWVHLRDVAYHARGIWELGPAPR